MPRPVFSFQERSGPPGLLEDYDHEELGHVTVVVSGRRWFRRVFWVRCWECDLRVGPFRLRENADEVAKEFWATNYRETKFDD